MNPIQHRYAALTLGALAAAALLAACGGGGSGGNAPPAATTVTLSGTVADGPLSGATACYDLNDNAACDAGEPTSAASDADGKFTLTVDESAAGKHAVIVSVPATAIDKDTGAAVGTAFVLRTPATGVAGAGAVFVSPLTTLVVDRMTAAGETIAEATALVQAQLGLTASPLANFVSSADAQAARLARVVNQVSLEVAKLAGTASVPADQAQALVASTTLGNLPTLAALSSGATGTPAEVATQVAATVLADRNLNASTVTVQAQVASQTAAPPPAGAASGPFVSVRNFSYTSASTYSYRLFTGDDSQLDATGAYPANEIRKTLAAGVEQPFNRNQVYWTGTTWQVCATAYRVVTTRPQTATLPQRSLYCGGSKSESRIATKDIDGRKMADVVAEMRAFPLPDNAGLPILWGPDPALLGTALFPAGSKLSTREQAADVGNTDRFSLTDKPRVLPNYKHAATFTELKQMSGNWLDAAAMVTGGNTAFLDDLAAAQADPALRPLKRHRVAFNPANDAVRFFSCDNRISDNASINCVAIGDGSSAIGTRADSRVLRINAGYPSGLTAQLKRQRLFVERDGVVFGGYTDLQHTVHQQRLNTAAWVALRDQLGIPAHTDPAAPPVNAPVEFLRSFTYSDAANYSYRLFSGSGVPDGTGTYSLDDHRVNVVGGVVQPFSFNSEFWTGTDWYACPNDLLGVSRYTLAPRTSSYCRSFNSTSTEPVVVTLDGRNMAEVMRDIRWYPSKDGVFDYASYGANPDTTPLLAAGTFPPGSTMYYQAINQTREPEQVFLGSQNQVRIAPAPNSSAPFDTWPFAATLEDAIAGYPGNYFGGSLNGNVALYVYRWFLPAPPDPAFTNEISVRVAFDSSGMKARFFQHNRSASTGFTTNYVLLLDTTYTIETIGGYRVLKFAQMPQEVLDRGGFARQFVERSGAVSYGSQTRIFPGGQHTIRLNGVAAEALGNQLGLVSP